MTPHHQSASAGDAHALKQCLDSCARIWLDALASETDVQKSAEELHALLTRLSAPLAEASCTTPQGKAISPLAAAHCLGDVRRSQWFVRAVDVALSTAAARFPGEPVSVAYAGCGPWTPLLLVLARRWSGRLRVHLIDMHSGALEQACALFALIGESAAIAQVSCSDAAQLVFDESPRPRVLICEIMQRALSVEPQVAVTAQLAPQLAIGGVMVPHRIVVAAALARIADGVDAPGERIRVPLAELIEVSVDTAPSLLQQIATGAGYLPAIEVAISADTPAGLNVILCTRIEVAPELLLDEYASGLTYPHVVHALGQVTPGQRLRFQYQLGVAPGFCCTSIR